MNITINDKFCWICGKTQNITAHHGIPQHIKPKHNIVIPVCRPCHDRIHNDDVHGMYAYLHKIEKTFEDGGSALVKMKHMLGENIKLKQNLEKLMKGKKVILD